MVGGTCQMCVNNCKNCYTESWSDFSAKVTGVESDRGSCMRRIYDRCLLPPGFKLVCFLFGRLI